MLYRVPLWRAYDTNDGSSGGAGGAAPGAPAGGAVAAPPGDQQGQPSAAQPTPQLDPQAYAALVVQNARLAARVQYPQADAAELDKLTDPGAIDAVARFSHEAALAKQQAQPPGGAPVPVPSDNATRVAESEEQRHAREMQYKIRQRMRPGSRNGRTVIEPWEAEDFRDYAFRVSWNAHMQHRRAGRGNVSDPPAGAPPVAQAQQIPAIGRAF